MFTKDLKLTGNIFFVEANYDSPPINFLDQYNNCIFYEKFELNNIIFQEINTNLKLKFDFNFSPDYYSGYCTGFLYKDNVFLAKAKYLKEANEEDSYVKGYYKKMTDDWLLIFGSWTYSNNDKYFFIIEIFYPE